MKKRLNAYIQFIDAIIAHKLPVNACFDEKGNHQKSNNKDTIPTRKDYEVLLHHHIEQIQFFQHERLIHLMVTILFALLTFLVAIVCYTNFSYALLGLMFALLVLLIPYIMHYYLLENGVQKMYRQYDEIVRQMHR